MGLMIRVKLKESDKRKRAMIINKIRRMSAYLSKAMKVRISRRLKSLWCHRI